MKAVPDPEPEIRVGGPVIQSLRQGEGGGESGLPEKFCSALIFSPKIGGAAL